MNHALKNLAISLMSASLSSFSFYICFSITLFCNFDAFFSTFIDFKRTLETLSFKDSDNAFWYISFNVFYETCPTVFYIIYNIFWRFEWVMLSFIVIIFGITFWSHHYLLLLLTMSIISWFAFKRTASTLSSVRAKMAFRTP